MFRTIAPSALALFLSIALSGASRADFAFQTPADISPGQSFNVVFYDSTGDSATSSNLADYNAAITSAASGISYAGGTIGSWSVIGATATPGDVNQDGIVNGLDISLVDSNWLQTGIGTAGDANGDGVVNGLDISVVASQWLRRDNGATGLFTSNLPVYDLSGKLLASTGGGDPGHDYVSVGPSPSIDQSGALYPAYPVWTGLTSGGFPGNSQYELGGGRFPSYGLSGYPPAGADGWGGLLGGPNEDTYSPANIRGLYGYAVFTAALSPSQAGGTSVPEPSTIVLAALGIFALLAYRRRR
jgi:hypothetical protein